MQIGEPNLFPPPGVKLKKGEVRYYRWIYINNLPVDRLPDGFFDGLPVSDVKEKTDDQGGRMTTFVYNLGDGNFLDGTFMFLTNYKSLELKGKKKGNSFNRDITREQFINAAKVFEDKLTPPLPPPTEKRRIVVTPTEKPTEKTPFQETAEQSCAISDNSAEMTARNTSNLAKYGITVDVNYYIRASKPGLSADSPPTSSALSSTSVAPSPKIDFAVGDWSFVDNILKSTGLDTLILFRMRYSSNLFDKGVGHVIGGFVTNTHIVLFHHHGLDKYDAVDNELKKWLEKNRVTKPLVIYPPSSEHYNIQAKDRAIQGHGACQRWYVALPYLIAKHLSNGKPYAEQTEEEKTETHRKWAELGTDWDTLVKPVYDEINKKPTDAWFKISQSSELVGMGRRRKTRRHKKRRITRRR